MRTPGLILLVSILLGWQTTARAGEAVLLKAHSYQVVRDGFLMPKRVLSIGTVVKVLTTHGKKADIATSSGDTVSIRLADLRMLTTSLPEQITTRPLVVATPAPPDPLPTPKPSPVPAGGTQAKAPDAVPTPPGEITRRAVSVRCSHVLKNGAQCSRMTTSPNGLCWQHGGN